MTNNKFKKIINYINLYSNMYILQKSLIAQIFMIRKAQISQNDIVLRYLNHLKHINSSNQTFFHLLTQVGMCISIHTAQLTYK